MTEAGQPIARSGEIAGIPSFWYEAPVADGPSTLYLHGVPTDADDFLPFLGRTGGLAPDLPGFGRSGKAPGFDYSIAGYTGWLRSFLERVGVGRFNLVVHDWGGLGLALAQAEPERIERLVIMDAVPLLPGYRWHRLARIWRTPVAGELFMGLSSRWALRLLTREASASPGPLPEEMIDRVWSRFDQGTMRAILRLYRSAPSDLLAEAGAGLARVGAPALVLWGAQDPYIEPGFARRYADALGGPAEVMVVEGAGHWPWVDRPEVVERVARFLLDGPA